MQAKPKPKPKPNEIIKLTFLVMTRDLPARVKLKDHSLEYSGSPAAPDLVAGVYGAHAKQMALVLASNWTKANKARRSGPNQILQLDVAYRADGLIDTLETAQGSNSGWMHFERLAADLRDAIKQEWLSWIRADLGAVRAARHTESSLAEISLEFPGYVARMMAKRSPRLTAVVHPVRPSLDPSAVLWVATVRYERQRFQEPVVRFLSQVRVDV